MRQVDLNADLGERNNPSLDALIMPYISSANIACGGHSGSSKTMRCTVQLAKEHGVAIGAHPSYPDPENFGRKSLNLSLEVLCREIRSQILALKEIAEQEGVGLRHVKLHGALYSDLAGDYERSLALCRMITTIDPKLRLIGFSNSETLRAAEDCGLVAVHEVFADRTYTPEGTLVPRSQPNAVIENDDACIRQVERFLSERSGLPADSICVHGDNPSAVDFVSKLSGFFERENIRVCPAGELEFRYRPLGENALLVQLPPRIAKTTHRKIRALQFALEQEAIAGVTELIPCYAELKINFDRQIISSAELKAEVARRAESIELGQLPSPRLIEIPVCYEPPHAPDLAEVSRQAGLSMMEVIRRHCSPTYLVYMLGFSPGFGYLGGLDRALATPRHAIPRTSVPAGSVGIAGNQTGIYPVDSPGGWQIIGRTPLALFDPIGDEPFLFSPGDEVRFVPVSAKEFESL